MTSKSSPFFRSLLDSVGQLNNTYIVFTSDNGFHLGQHRLNHGKETGFEEDIHTPLLIRGPGLPAGRVVDSLTVNIDFAPTFAELAGATTPGFVDGRSLVPLLDGTLPTTWRNSFLLGHSRSTPRRHSVITSAKNSHPSTASARNAGSTCGCPEEK
jgi:N-acetylglucosamine-6-sulfatase